MQLDKETVNLIAACIAAVTSIVAVIGLLAIKGGTQGEYRALN
jgi:hypothetical protein